jgi:hypothetical protein
MRKEWSSNRRGSNTKKTMNKMKQVIMQIFLLVFLQSFNSCAQLTREEQINHTLQKTLIAINTKDYATLRKMIGNNMDTNVSNIVSNVIDTKYFVDKYYKGHIDKLHILSKDSLDEMGRKLYRVELFKGFDSVMGVSNVALLLYVGPPQIIPLDRLSGFEMSMNVDVEYRKHLMENGTLFDFDSVYYKEFEKFYNR